MKIYSLLQSITNIKRTFKCKVLFNIIYSVKNISIRYLSQQILITKKSPIQWGMNPIFLYLLMSDNMHYVNLLPNQHGNDSKVGDCPSFRHLGWRIGRGRGAHQGATKISLKNSKSLIINIFKKIFSGKGYKAYSRLCKLIETALRIGRMSGGRVFPGKVRSQRILRVRYA